MDGRTACRVAAAARRATTPLGRTPDAPRTAPATQSVPGGSSFRFGCRERLPGFDIGECLHDARWPSDLDERGRGVSAEPDGQPLVARGEVADGWTHREVLIQA